uniref:Uncharacterized protein n=1 Tax=viral metagenome TaxID=1070528 RepID=A0A6C0DMW2_9ZZZZ
MANDDKPKLSDYDITVYNIKRNNMFKGTILMCIIYAIFAFILIITAYVSESLRTVLFERFLPFTLVYIVGTIIIILIFIGLIFSYKPEKIDDSNQYPRVSCPDYWKLEIVDDYTTKKLFSNEYDSSLFKYKCVMDTNVFSKDRIFTKNNNPDDLNGGTDLKTEFRLTGMNPNTNLGGFRVAGKLTDINSNLKDKGADYFHLFKNINNYIDPATNKFTDSTLQKITTQFGQADSNLRNNIIDASMIMNNYELSTVNTYTNLQFSTSNHDIAPISWNIAGGVGIGTSAPALNANSNYATIVDWCNITVDLIKKKAGSDSPLNVHVIKDNNTTTTIVGTVNLVADLSDSNTYYRTFNTNTNISSTNLTLYYPNNSNSPTNSLYVGYLSPNAAAADLSGVAAIKTYFGSDNYYVIVNILDSTYFNSNITKTALQDNNSNAPLICDRLYPAFLANQDKDTNAIRCAYSAICGVKWSDMHCDKYVKS